MPTSRHRFTLVAAALLVALGPVRPAFAGLVTNYGAYDTLSAYPLAGAILDTRWGTAQGQIPVAWNTALVMGNGAWELGLVSAVAGQTTPNYVKFDSLAPWGRVRLPNLFGVPLALIAGATVPAATGSASTAGLGLAVTFDWDGDRVDLNLGARLDPADPGKRTQGAAHVLFTHPLGKDFDGNAELVFHAGSPATESVMIQRLGFTRTWSDNWASDISVAVETPLGDPGALLKITPSLGLSYTF